MSRDLLYSYEIPAASHWSFRARRGTLLKFTDIHGGANLAALFYNPEDYLERYNAPDTLKCQHTFKLTKGHCLYSDMGRIFCSVVDDSFGWHDTVCGNANKNLVEKKWGHRDYQQDRNDWKQNGYDSFLVELAKYGLGQKDMAANVNFFSQVVTDEEGDLSLRSSGKKGDSVTLRIEMDSLVVLHTCPHPLNMLTEYPRKSVRCDVSLASPIQDDDYCKNRCSENQRGFENNRLYHFGLAVR